MRPKKETRALLAITTDWESRIRVKAGTDDIINAKIALDK